jgi:hypothetical protein
MRRRDAKRGAMVERRMELMNAHEPFDAKPRECAQFGDASVTKTLICDAA